MDRTGFEQYLEDRGSTGEAAAAAIEVAERFERFAAGRGGSADAAPVGDLRAFLGMLIDEGANTWEALLALARFAGFSGNRPAAVEVLGLLDGSEALGNLIAAAGGVLGEERAGEVLSGVVVPPLGTPLSELPPVTAEVMRRLSEALGREALGDILSGCLRDLDDAWYAADRAAYLAADGIDAFLEWRRSDFLETLERCRDEDRLFFTQPVTDDVIGLVRSDPEMHSGRRSGSTIFEVKIPHTAAEWLAAGDPVTRRYHACHCPWVKESLREGGSDVPAEFCACSAGFHKRYWEAVLGRPLQAEIVESVLAGDDRCRIAIHLPDDVLPSGAHP
jgi:hypothetical protein